jgi:excisionase family DNA binding protein
MAGMFYSLEEAIEKLNKTKEELKELVKEGKLREFRDGSNVLFKVEEVEALKSEMAPESLEIPEAELEITPTPESTEPEMPEFEISEELETPTPSEEVSEETKTPAASEEAPEETKAPAASEEAPEETKAPTASEETPEETKAPTPSEEDADLDEILLAPETGTPAISGDLTDADTAITGQGTSILGQTDRDYEITDDTMADTVIKPETSSEVPLEEIEEDVNLDSFGSGSGLLDLSLQADDTSLGGILDEIYTAEGEGPEAGEVEAGSAAAMAAEAEQIMPEEGLAVPQPTQEVTPYAAPVIGGAPEKESNILGMLLFIPLIAVIYTIVVVIAGRKGIIPSILAGIQDFIWYIIAAAIVVAGLGAGMSFMLGGQRSTTAKPKKAKKEKPPKKEKVKKEKKPKKEKKSKKLK